MCNIINMLYGKNTSLTRRRERRPRGYCAFRMAAAAAARFSPAAELLPRNWSPPPPRPGPGCPSAAAAAERRAASIKSPDASVIHSLQRLSTDRAGITYRIHTCAAAAPAANRRYITVVYQLTAYRRPVSVRTRHVHQVRGSAGRGGRRGHRRRRRRDRRR